MMHPKCTGCDRAYVFDDPYCDVCRSKQKRAISRKKQRECYVESLASKLLRSAQARALKRHLPFDLTEHDIVIPRRCPILGIPLASAVGKVTRGSPSLDRIIPALGYVRGNVRVISHRANTIKNNGTLEEFQAIVNYIESSLLPTIDVRVKALSMFETSIQ